MTANDYSDADGQLIATSATGAGSDIDSNDIVSATYQPNPTTGAADSSIATTVTVDALGETLTSTDPDGTTHTYDYDVLGQQVADEVTTLGDGVDGSVMEIGTTYTTLGDPQYTTTYSTVDSPGDIVNQVEDVYNGLDQLVQEYQSVSGAVGDDTPYVEYNYTDMSGSVNNSRLTSIVYPDGYTVDYNYSSGLDSDISRLSSISDFTGTLQSYQYLGLDTIVVMAEPQADIELTYLTTDDGTGDAGDEYTGLDQFGRVIEQDWYNTSTDTSVVDLQYGYDDDGNVLFENNTLESTQSELFTYDNLGQLTSYEQGTLSDDNTVIASPSITETWGYDALGNHLTDTTNSVTITSTFNYDNQITSISSGTTPTYDADGNMTTDQNGFVYTYNAWNNEVDVYSGTTLEENYTYDGRNYRMTDTVYSGGTDATTNLYNSSADQVLEEQAASTGYYSTRYVWSQNCGSQMVSRDTDTSGAGLTPSGSDYSRVWPVADANFNTVALVVMSDGSATVEERYAYDPFGAVTYMTGSYGSESSSAYGWVYLFQGMRLDAVTGSNLSRSREENPGIGSWTTQDPARFMSNDMVLYGFENNRPTTQLDPSGLLPNGINIGPLAGISVSVYFGEAQGQTVNLFGNPDPGAQGYPGHPGGNLYYLDGDAWVFDLIFAQGGTGGQGGSGDDCNTPGGGGGGARIQIGNEDTAVVATGGGGGGGGYGSSNGGAGGNGGAVQILEPYYLYFYDGVGYGDWYSNIKVSGGTGTGPDGSDGGDGGGGPMWRSRQPVACSRPPGRTQAIFPAGTGGLGGCYGTPR